MMLLVHDVNEFARSILTASILLLSGMSDMICPCRLQIQIVVGIPVFVGHSQPLTLLTPKNDTHRIGLGWSLVRSDQDFFMQ